MNGLTHQFSVWKKQDPVIYINNVTLLIICQWRKLMQKKRRIYNSSKLLLPIILNCILLLNACRNAYPNQAEAVNMHFYDLMNLQDFKTAKELCHFEPTGLGCLGFSEEDFILNMEMGADVRYEIISLIDGTELSGLNLDDPRGMSYVFPDEQEDECKSFLATIRYKIQNGEGAEQQSFVFNQKISVVKHNGQWKVGSIRYPSDMLCTDALPSKAKSMEVDTSEPESLINGWYLFRNEDNSEQAEQLIATDSPEFESLNHYAEPDPVLGEVYSVVVEMSEPVSCKYYNSESYTECLQVDVTEQTFYGSGFIVKPSGSIDVRRWQMVLTDDGWRLWRVLYP